ncbi:hypothetical protein KFE25_001445 [Diacronema lutheri]|uniref:Type II secretion system protein GspF domain-containing protein n=1 Tax=Diacronema lutheri TaxID=2081491 RepID=A0A8J6C4L5_DIALT|nr:hypothetical protein KFE25_001445 [Diacronema lutheri]
MAPSSRPRRWGASALALALLVAEGSGARLVVRRGTRAEVLPRCRSPLSLVRPSDLLVCEDGGALRGSLQSASIGAGFLFLADELELAQLEADDEQALRTLAAQAVARLPVGKRLWWIGTDADTATVGALTAAGFERASLGEAARALWPALAFFGTPIFLLPALVLAFPLLPQALALVGGLSAAERAALAAAPPVLALAFAAAALVGRIVLRGDGARAG